MSLKGQKISPQNTNNLPQKSPLLPVKVEIVLQMREVHIFVVCGSTDHVAQKRTTKLCQPTKMEC